MCDAKCRQLSLAKVQNGTFKREEEQKEGEVAKNSIRDLQAETYKRLLTKLNERTCIQVRIKKKTTTKSLLITKYFSDRRGVEKKVFARAI